MKTINIYYTGKQGAAQEFAKEMMQSGLVDQIRQQKGNIRYEYFQPLTDDTTILLIDCWENEEALDIHHQSPMMHEIIKLREKYDLIMRVEEYTSKEIDSEKDNEFIRTKSNL